MNISTVNELIQSLAKAYQQLAAENVALKAEQVRIFNSGYLRGHEPTVEGYYVDIHQDDITTYHEDVVAEISEEQTPATDRIVAGIKADGAKAAGDYLKLEAQHMPVVERLMMQDAAEICYGTAARLREGAK
ncbi:hypothetical protein [Klebsiella pneumoniae]|jgi:hypothetical protein|uniref:hypothetical protein n=1 Tax=Klebsiella pneumoniae TaxID=573 RepID=UPI0021A40CFA|nr:hypothetical protein [Klebsiella pneumoniae]EIX9642891.1 hypothetical protein [Klebsiella pneumoniae]MDP1327005.1 hypothetical protein [Klebsiella pneumoniae]MDP1349612.1 hypothetical protein [Klebsiella pneumoniae]MDP1409655.1 hypothetical protein [Klebsiella pneumoniae]